MWNCYIKVWEKVYRQREFTVSGIEPGTLSACVATVQPTKLIKLSHWCASSLSLMCFNCQDSSLFNRFNSNWKLLLYIMHCFNVNNNLREKDWIIYLTTNTRFLSWSYAEYYIICYTIVTTEDNIFSYSLEVEAYYLKIVQAV